MLYTYRTRKDTVQDEDGEKYTVYGIEAVDSEEKVLLSFPDIFFDPQQAESFAELCNESELSLTHLADAVEDALTEQYAI